MKKSSKKILFSFLALSSSALAACSQIRDFKILANYNGQADLLLSLQIPPDYYPLQFKETSYRPYLLHPDQFVITNDHTDPTKAEFKTKLAQRFQALLKNVKVTGPSLWNNAIYDSGAVQRNTEFWTRKRVKLMFMERFVLDDYKNETLASKILPRHDGLIQTNFRASRDPFTTFSADVYNHINDSSSADTTAAKLAKILNDHYNSFPDSETPDALFRYASYMKFWQQNIYANQEELKQAGFFHWIKNDPQLTNGAKGQGQSEYTKSPIFYPDAKWQSDHVDENLSKLYQQVILDGDAVNKLNKAYDEKTTGGHKHWDLNYLSLFNNKGMGTGAMGSSGSGGKGAQRSATTLIKHNQSSSTPINFNGLKAFRQHHPAYEQQATPGSSPAAEGSQRDTMVYLFQLANGINEYVKNHKLQFEQNFKTDPRYNFLINALHNTSLISFDLHQRLINIRKYLQEIGVVDKNYDPDKGNYHNCGSKTLGLLTFPPSAGGNGNATLQTISKYAFIYNDLGLKQPLPVYNDKGTEKTLDLDYTHKGANTIKYAGENSQLPEKQRGNELFNIDDNGWWWNLGNGTETTGNITSFHKTSDTLIIAATNQDWKKITGQTQLDKASNPYVKTLSTLAKGYNTSDEVSKISTPEKMNNSYPISQVEYGLWNEGLRSPFSVNMVLDQLVNILQHQYDPEFKQETTETTKKLYSDAMNWGNYWTNDFVNGRYQTTFTTDNLGTTSTPTPTTATK